MAKNTDHRLHIEMISGIAGDMSVASLLSLSVDFNHSHTINRDPDLKNVETVKRWLVNKLSLLIHDDNIYLDINTVKPGGIKSLQINFRTPEDDWHKHDHNNKNHHHKHLSRRDGTLAHRNFTDIESLIEKASLSDQVKAGCLKTFEVLAKAEGAVHDTDYRKVHFHEVGSLDAILEVCSFFLLLEKWNIDKVTATPVVIGSGSVNCAHGLMPIPVPAVLEMLTTYKIPHKKIYSETGELTTPTGLAILIGSGCEFLLTNADQGPLSSPLKIGYGAGHKKIPELVNFLRTTLHTHCEESLTNQIINETIFEIKVNLDDMTGEEISSLVEGVFSAGAIDVCQYPVYMKKNRPGVVLEILSQEKNLNSIKDRLLSTSSTLGYRYIRWEREILPRKIITLEYRGITFPAKEISFNGDKRIKVEDSAIKSGMAELSLSRRKLVEELNSLYRERFFKKTSPLTKAPTPKT